MTHPTVAKPPSTLEATLTYLDVVLASPSVRVLNPGPAYPRLLASAVREAKATGSLVFNAQTVAVCREHDIERFLTEDRDFDRFSDFATERI